VSIEGALVLLVHGTLASADPDEGDAWWQRGSPFHRFLSGELSDAAVQPAGYVFHWSGANRETERRRAGATLARRIIELEAIGRPYSLVGHSHGGSVIWHALTDAFAARGGLPNLMSCITVGTPFLYYGPARTMLWQLVPFVVALVVSAWAGPTIWHTYRANFGDFIQYPDWWFGLAVPLLCLALVVVTALIVAGLVRGGASIIRERRLERTRTSCYAHVADRFVPIASIHDEAINGLAGSLAFSGEIVPRARGPLAWIYNRFLAVAGDDFIWQQLGRRTQGSDLPGLALHDVLPLPIRGDHGALLPAAVDADLEARANQRAQSFAGELRQALQRIAYHAYPIDYLRSAAAAAGAIQSLIHAGYFEHPDVRRLLLTPLRGERPHDTPSSPPAPRPVAGRRAALPRMLPALTAVSLSVVVGWLALTVHGLAAPASPEALLRAAIRGLPFAQATYEGTYDRKPIPYRFLSLLALAGMESTASELIDQTDEGSLTRHQAWAAVAEGLVAAGRATAAQPFFTRALEHVQVRKPLPRGQEGPEEVASEAALDLIAALGRANRLADVETILARPESAEPTRRSQIIKAMLVGLIRARNLDPIPAWLRLMPDVSERRDAFEIFVRTAAPIDTAESLLDAFTGSDHQEATAAIIEAKASVEHLGRLERLLPRITDVGPRIVATTTIAKLLVRSGRRDAGLRLLDAEHAALGTRRRHPIEGHAVHYVRLAEAYRAAGDQQRAEMILRFAETLGAERHEGTTYQDWSGDERALLWARLGVTDLAIARATATRAGNRGLLEQVLVILAQAGKRDQAIGGLTANVGASRQLSAEIALFDDEQKRMTARRRFTSLDTFSIRARAIKDPATRSEMLRAVALRWADTGNIRRALLLSNGCFPVDRAVVLNHLLSQNVTARGPLEFGRGW
jgi:hypothetical protein